MTARRKGWLAGLLTVAVCGVPGAARAADAAPFNGCGGADKPILIDAESLPRQRLRADALAEQATGKGVVVAIVDSGINADNRHFPAKAVLPGKSFIRGDTTKGRTDVYGHGTAIAGIIAARAVRGSTVVGIAPQAKILPVRVFVGPPGAGVRPRDIPRLDRIADGITWAANNGADIINVSMSAPTEDGRLAEAVARARRQGALVLASVGNKTDQSTQTEAGSDVERIPDGLRYPAASSGVLGVTAADLGSSGVTYDSVAGRHVDIAAPGEQVLTSWWAGGDCVLAAKKSSTSFATGYASGAAAVLAERFPQEGPTRLAYRLQASAERALIGTRTDEQGWGLIRPLAAIDLTVPAGRLPPVGRQAEPTTAEGPAITIAAAVDPRQDAKDATGWLLAFGAAGVALVLLLGGLTAKRVGR